MLGTQSRIAWPLVSSDLWRDMPSRNGKNIDGQPERTWNPNALMTESENAFTILLDLPGVDRTTMELDLDGEYLSIRGERPAPTQDDSLRVVLNEGPWGRFHRRFRLGSGLDRDAITAEYHDGLLEISVPKREEARPRRIPISTEA